MSVSNQRQLILIASLGLTALLAGSMVSGLVVWRVAQRRIQDAEFLQKQLDRVNADANTSAPKIQPALVRVSVARRKKIQPQRPIIGRLVEVRKVTVASEVTGKIVEMAVEEGTPVIAGKTVLAEVDKVWSELAAKRCRAQAQSTAAKLKYEQAELERYQQLKDTISESELDSKQVAVDELTAELAVCEATMEVETERVTRSTIVPPFDGVVVAKHAELGGHVSPGTPIVDVVSRGQIDARLMVPESVINLVEVLKNTRHKVPIQIDPLGEEVRGTVVSATPYGPTASRTFPVRVRLDDQQGRLKIGMSVTAMIATGPEREALVVTKDAVLVRPDGATVWVALPKKAPAFEVQPVPVTISVRMQHEYAVEPETPEGRKLLTSGVRVVVEGAERLTPRQQVEIDPLDDGPGAVAGSSEAERPAPEEPGSKAASSPATRQES